MKKKTLIVEVPEWFDETEHYFLIEIREANSSEYIADAKYAEFTPPSEKEIQKEADKHYEYELYNDTYFRRGAEWFKSLLQ